jgi:adenylate cyclase
MSPLAERETSNPTGGGHPAAAAPVRRRGISMRTSLVLGFGSVLLLTAAGILFNSAYTSRKIVGTLSTTILEQSRDLTELKLDDFFGVVSGINAATARRLENGLLPWQDWDSLRLFLLPVLQRVTQVSAVGAGDGEGNAYNLVRFGDNWRSQEIQPSEWGTRTLWKEWTLQGQLVKEWWEESDFDPRQRPWFTGALAEAAIGESDPDATPMSQRPFWTAPYKFFTTGEYGLTVSTCVPWTNALDAVVYFDVTLDDLDDFVKDSRPSANGFVLVLNRELQVLGWPGIGAYARTNVLAGQGGVNLVADKLPNLSTVLQVWRDSGEPDELVEYAQRENRNMWMGFRSLQGVGTKFLVMVVVPEDDILGEARKERRRMAIVLAVGILAGVGLAFWLAALYTRPISSLVQWSEAIQRLDLGDRAKISSRVTEVQALSSAQGRMSSALESFSRYVPRDVIAELLRQGEAARIGAHPAELTVLFSDIRRFTSISETLSPNDVARQLSEYFDVLHGGIERHQGTTDKFIGDAIMAFWGAPRPDAQHALHAVRAVLECTRKLDELNQRWMAAGRPVFETTFGLATGAVVVGNVGARNRLNYTVLGNTVNVASRCVGLGRELGCSILALESVAHATCDQIDWRRLGPVQVRGIRDPMMVCEPLGMRGEVSPEAIEFKAHYEGALDAYLNKEFAAALTRLEQLARRYPDSLSVCYLIRRCHALENNSPTDLHAEMLSFD